MFELTTEKVKGQEIYKATVYLTGNNPETCLINALDTLIYQFSNSEIIKLKADQRLRAVDWLQAKYGTPR